MKPKGNKKIYLSGGLGNVLFQLVLYLKFQNEGYNVYINKTLVEQNYLTSLLKWKIHSQGFNIIFKDLNVQISKESDFSIISSLIKGKISAIINKPFLDTYFFSKKWNENQLNNSSIFFGYFQDRNFLVKNESYVKSIVSSLIKYFLDYQNIKHNIDIIVHYRLGDSIWANNTSYYLKVRNKLKCFNKPFLVVTDSPYEAELFFQGSGEFIVVKNDPIMDFGILINANVLFIAPSTFSYWASLCLGSKQKVFIPQFLFKNIGFPGEANFTIL